MDRPLSPELDLSTRRPRPRFLRGDVVADPAGDILTVTRVEWDAHGWLVTAMRGSVGAILPEDSFSFAPPGAVPVPAPGAPWSPVVAAQMGREAAAGDIPGYCRALDRAMQGER